MWDSIHGTYLPGKAASRSTRSRAHLYHKPATETEWETCEIQEVEGLCSDDRLVRCHWFQANATGPVGRYTAGRSGGFYCPTWAPEPEYSARQLQALVSQLVAEGWEAAGLQGTGWWRLTFRRPLAASQMVPR